MLIEPSFNFSAAHKTRHLFFTCAQRSRPSIIKTGFYSRKYGSWIWQVVMSINTWWMLYKLVSPVTLTWPFGRNWCTTAAIFSGFNKICVERMYLFRNNLLGETSTSAGGLSRRMLSCVYLAMICKTLSANKQFSSARHTKAYPQLFINDWWWLCYVTALILYLLMSSCKPHHKSINWERISSQQPEVINQL